MKIELECGEYYDFHNIRSVKKNGFDSIIVDGNFNKGGRYKKIKLNIGMLKSKSYNNLIKYLNKYYKTFHYEGICPFCDSDKILIHEDVFVSRLINHPKSKEIEYKPRQWVNYQCARCKKFFTKEQLKYIDIVLWYK